MAAKTKGKYNSRQRKKLRIGEFQELGFDVTARSAKVLSPEERDRFMNDLIENAIEANGLLFGGGFNDDLEGFAVIDAARGSATEAQLEAIRNWLLARPELSNVQVGPLKDAWYS